MRRLKKTDPFPQVQVSERFHRHVQALESAAMQVGEARTPEDLYSGHRAISLAREALYQYAESLEKRDRSIRRDITLRF